MIIGKCIDFVNIAVAFTAVTKSQTISVKLIQNLRIQMLT